MLSKSHLEKYLSYNPETGKLYWKARTPDMFSREPDCRTWNTKNAGNEAGSLFKNGYLCISINRKKLYCHRIAAVLGGLNVEGLQVDHINGDRTDNRLCNLRAVSNKENGKNQKIRNTNTTGLNGVYFDRRRGKKPWYVKYGDNGWGGSFCTKKEAEDARRKIDKSLGFHHLHGTKKGP